MALNLLNGLVGLVIFILDVWAIAQIVSSSASGGKKVLWVLIVAFLPILGLIAWYFLGPKGNLKL